VCRKTLPCYSSITWSKVDWFRQFSNFEPPFSLLTTIKTLFAWKHILLIFRGNKFSRSWDSRHNIQGLSISANWLTWESELWQDISRTAMTSRVKKKLLLECDDIVTRKSPKEENSSKLRTAILNILNPCYLLAWYMMWVCMCAEHLSKVISYCTRYRPIGKHHLLDTTASRDSGKPFKYSIHLIALLFSLIGKHFYFRQSSWLEFGTASRWMGVACPMSMHPLRTVPNLTSNPQYWQNNRG